MQPEQELSSADLKALDLLLAHLDEKGQTSISSHDLALATPAIAFVLREAVKWAVKYAARTAICAQSTRQLPDNADPLEILAQIKREISVEELQALRRNLQPGASS